jgi:hypothetical protein
MGLKFNENHEIAMNMNLLVGLLDEAFISHVL